MTTAFDFPLFKSELWFADSTAGTPAKLLENCATDVIWHNAQSNVFLKAVHDTQERGVEKSVHVF